MSAAHTPGPWTLTGKVEWVGDGDRADSLWCGDVKPSGKFRGRIASIQSCDHIGGITREEAAANARLIAAAPDLLRVAELLVDWLNEEEGAHKLCDTARAAIALAKGAA